MKIGFVLDDRLDKPDGVQQYVSLVGSWLCSRGHDVHYLVGHSPNAKQANVHHLSKTVGVKFNKNRMAIPLPASSKKIRLLLENERFDVLHVQMPYSPLLAGKVINAALPATAVVGTFHILPHGRASSLGTSALSALVKKSKKRFDGIISVSSAASSFAQSHFGITSTILPNIVDLSRYNKGAALKIYSDKENIIFLGRFVERKGAHYLLSAYGQLITDHPELALVTRLILCGDGPDRSKLEESAADIRKAGGDIVFTGFLQEDEKKNYLASATLAVFPSTGGESFGIVLIEAMAAGAGAVLGGDNPGYLTVIGDNPLAVVQPKKTVAFSKSLHTLLTDSEKRTTLHASQQTAVKEYDVAVVGPKIEQFYRDALASRTITKHT